jgi:hypothetical protein
MVWESAVEIPSTATEALGNVVRETGVHLAMGVIERDGQFSGGTLYCTLLYFGPDGQMFVTSRLEGVVYKLNPFKEAVSFARNLGVATGIAFDSRGLMYIGDRTGTIFKVNGIGEERAWKQVEPSVSAFHLAFGPDDSLYIAGPTVTSFDCIWRLNPDLMIITTCTSRKSRSKAEGSSSNDFRPAHGIKDETANGRRESICAARQ